MADVSRILVLGADLSTTQHVIQQLYTLVNDTRTLPHHVKESVFDLVLTTKYYHAPIELHVHQLVDNELITTLQHEIEAYEALIWVVDMMNMSSFLHTRRFVEKSMEELDFDVNLVVGVHAEDASALPLETLEQWAQSNTFEFVPVHVDMRSDQEETEDQNETRGMHRVLEALQCNMWRSMVMSDPSLSSKTAVVSTTADVSNQETHEKEQKEEQQPALSDYEQLQHAMQALTTKEDEEEDQEMRAFGDLVAQVKRIRSTGRTLSDGERRQQAEQVAMQLWNMLGGEEDDEKSGEEEED